MTDQAKQNREEFAEKYVESCRNHCRSVNGITEAYCKADFRAGFNEGYSTAMSEVQVLIDALEKITLVEFHKGTNGQKCVDIAKLALKQFRQEVEK